MCYSVIFVWSSIFTGIHFFPKQGENARDHLLVMHHFSHGKHLLQHNKQVLKSHSNLSRCLLSYWDLKKLFYPDVLAYLTKCPSSKVSHVLLMYQN